MKKSLRNLTVLLLGSIVGAVSGCSTIDLKADNKNFGLVSNTFKEPLKTNDSVPPLIPPQLMDSLGDSVPRFNDPDLFIFPAPPYKNEDRKEKKDFYDGTICSLVTNPSRDEFRNLMQRMSIPYSERAHERNIEGDLSSFVCHNFTRPDGSLAGEWVNNNEFNLFFNKDDYYAKGRRDGLEVSVNELYNLQTGVFTEVDGKIALRISVPTEYHTMLDPLQSKDYTDSLILFGRTEQCLDESFRSRYYAGIGWIHHSRADIEAYDQIDFGSNVNLITLKVGKRIPFTDEGIGSRFFVTPSVSALYASGEVYPGSGSGFMDVTPRVELCYRAGNFTTSAYVGRRFEVYGKEGDLTTFGIGFDWKF